MKNAIYYILISTYILLEVDCSTCDCSGHGSCNFDNPTFCDCDVGYQLAPDCSRKSCPTGYAWADKPSADNVAHAEAECSNQGVCEYRTGTCRCMPGYGGAACQKLLCGPNNCNNHGVCMPISSVYTLFTVGSNGTDYSSWDGDQASMCVCYSGYTGPECEMIMCPKGDDPLTTTEQFRTISITTSATDGILDGYFTLRFNNYYFDFPGHGSNWTKFDCRNLFQSMANVDIASCTMGEVGGDGSITVVVELREFPLRPVENNIYFHEGSPDISQFQCDTTFVEGAAGVTCVIADVVNDTAVIPGE